MNKHIFNEAVWLRAIACLTVVLCHSMETASIVFLDNDPNAVRIKSFLYIFLMATFFATPAFVFLSEFIIARKYSSHLPSGFLKKRVKYILYPYVFMSVVYAFTDNDSISVSSVISESLKNIFLGESTVYFVLIVFQFYLLHVVFYKKLDQWNPKIVLISTLLINIGYLAIFNFVEAPSNPIATYIWGRGHWIIFLGWLFYFSLGYYAGKYYESLKRKLNSKRMLLSLVFTSGLFLLVVLVNKYLKVIDAVSSKRIDILFYTVSIILLVFSVSILVNKTPNLFIVLSNYSFSIYLIHRIFLGVFETVHLFSQMNIFIFIAFSFVFSLGASMLLSYFINKLSFGRYLVGQNQQLKTIKDTQRMKAS